MPFRKQTWNHDVARWAYIMIVVMSAVAIGILYFQGRNSNHKVRQLALSLSRESKERAGEIQKQRYQFVLEACQDQNARHDLTIHRLHTLVNELTDGAKTNARASERSTIFLINALVPRKNCKKAAKAAVHPPPPKKKGK